jgi:hypothetical protein
MLNRISNLDEWVNTDESDFLALECSMVNPKALGTQCLTCGFLVFLKMRDVDRQKHHVTSQ